MVSITFFIWTLGVQNWNNPNSWFITQSHSDELSEYLIIFNPVKNKLKAKTLTITYF